MRVIQRTRRPVVAIAAALAVLVVAAVAPVSAIRHGQPDGERHPYVGLLVAHDADGAPLWRCSATLLSNRLALTAGHCTVDAAHVELFFDEAPANNEWHNDPCGNSTGFPCVGDVGGTPFTHPDYDDDTFWLADLGVVVLDAPFSSPSGTYGKLPREDRLDGLKPGRRTTFTTVGYGLNFVTPSKETALWERMYARTRLLQINNASTGDYSIVISSNARTGGFCFGDSGGPTFIGTSRVIAGVNSFVRNNACAGTGNVFRVDRAAALDWLTGEFGSLLP